MEINVNKDRILSRRDPMIYGQFIEHFHRQIYGGIYNPESSLSDEDGFRMDVLEALKKISPPVLRWPGGCFVSSYHWKDGVGKRKEQFDKAWRVEEPNVFGTDEFIKYCRKLNSRPYICTNAGTGTSEEMSDWVEYCNLKTEGYYAKQRINNGSNQTFNVPFWSIGNENYGAWEIGAKTSSEWSRFVTESAKMMKRADPTIEISAAALADVNWNLELLNEAGEYLDWISIHEYWDFPDVNNKIATYEEVMAYTTNLDRSIKRTKGILDATGYSSKVKIAFDEWNLRAWYHPHSHIVDLTANKEEYIMPRDKNDDNTQYTMADAVFTACFLNTLLRNSDIVRMANFSPTVNTRGMIFTYNDGIVLRSTYHVFDLYVNHMGDEVIDSWSKDVPVMEVKNKHGGAVSIDQIDFCATRKNGKVAISLINKSTLSFEDIEIRVEGSITNTWTLITIRADHMDDYNDVHQPKKISITDKEVNADEHHLTLSLPAHSVSVLKQY